MSQRRIRCLSCKELVLPKIDYYEPDKPYCVVPISLPQTRGCVCSNCVEKYSGKFESDINNAHSDKISAEGLSEHDENNSGTTQNSSQKEDSSTTSQKNQSKTSSQKESDSIEETISELTKLTKKYSCLDYSLDSLATLVKKEVFGQDEFVEKLLCALYLNQTANLLADYGENPVKRKHILFIGNTGVGKTFLTKTTAKIFKVPFSLSNATPITSAGYVGDKVEHVLERLYYEANKDLELAQNGIIIIDEIDKKAATIDASGKDVSGLAVQQELLKLLEPSTVWIEKHTIPFDTTNLTVIMMGAFVGLEDIIKKRTNSKKIGFEKEENTSSLADLTPDDLIEYGFIPEMVGRAPLVYVLNDLTKEDMVSIIYNILLQYNLFFKVRNFDFIFDHQLIERIAESALEAKTGARDLDSKIYKILQPALYRLFQSPPDGICEVHADGSIELLAKSRESKFMKPKIFHFEPLDEFVEVENEE